MVTVEDLVKKLRAARHWCPGDAFTDSPGCAYLLDVNPKTLYRWRKARTGPAWIEGGPRQIRYDLQDIVVWLNGEKISPDKGGQERANAGSGDSAKAARALVST
jgi:hypothetical protein